MTTSIQVFETDSTTIAAPTEDDGIGALRTAKGNLPLESIDVRLATTGLAVTTELTQGFRNPYDEPLEATYIFPLPPRAALTALRMEADDRVIEGVLQERQQAREAYDQAIAEGRRASIAEEERPGVFTMRVGNIMPGEHVKVRMTLAGLLPYEQNLTEGGEATLRFPLVVAPRYIPGNPLPGGDVGAGVNPDTDAVPDASRITPPVLLPGFPNPIELSITVDVDPAGLPLESVASSLHPIDTEEGESGRLRLKVHPGQRADRDFVLRLRLGAEDAVTSSLVTVPDKASTEKAESSAQEGTFALTLLPPNIAVQARPRDVVFVLDRSGSMAGWKMVAARRAAARIVDTLGTADRFAVLAFDHTVETPPLLPSGLVEATDRHRYRAVEHLARMDARGGTEMLAPLIQAADLLNASTATGPSSGPAAGPAADGERDRVLVLVTDGQVGNEDQILRELAPRLSGVRVHTVGIDVAVNEAFLGRLAHLGGGHSELVESEDRLDAAMEAIHRRVGTPILTDVRLSAEGLDVVADSIAPTVLPSLYAGAAVVILGRYRGSAEGGSIRVLGKASGAPRAERLIAKLGDNPALAGVWARARLRDLEDKYSTILEHDKLDGLEKQIVATSLRFGVMCRFTAFVAIDSRIVNEGGQTRKVTQPVDLPQGWALSDSLGALPPEAVAGGGTRLMAVQAGLQSFSVQSAAPLMRRASQASARPAPRRSLPFPEKHGVPGAPDIVAPSMPSAGVPNPPSIGGPGTPSAGDHGSGATEYDELDVPDFLRDGPPDYPARQQVRDSAAAVLAELEAAEPAERPRLLLELRPRLGALSLALSQAGADSYELRLLRELEVALEAYAKSPSQQYETERLWLNVLDVLRALAASARGGGPGGFRFGGGGSDPAAPRGQRPTRRGPFWRRT